METSDFESARNWRWGGWFGIALILLTSWTRKARNEASDDMVEKHGVEVDNPLPGAELTQSLTQEPKKLPQGEAYSLGKTRPRGHDSGDSA